MNAITQLSGPLLKGKKGLILGVANEWSLAWGIAQAAHAAGASLVLSYPNEALQRRVLPMAAQVGADAMEIDVQNDEHLAGLTKHFSKPENKLDFVVHAVAFANKDELRGGITNTTREGFKLAMEVSCYSFIAITKALEGCLNEGASLLTLTYEGSTKVVPNYNIMGVAKAALESATRYLAAEMGPQGVRVNAISAGPVNTLAARGIGGFNAMLKHHAATAPLRRLTSQEDVAGAALFLLSSLGSGTTGEVLMVDTGAHILGPTVGAE